MYDYKIVRQTKQTHAHISQRSANYYTAQQKCSTLWSDYSLRFVVQMIVYRLGHQHGHHRTQRLALAIKVVASYGIQLRLGGSRLQQLQQRFHSGI